MKKIVLYLLCINIVGNVMFAASKVGKNAKVSLTAVTLPTLTIDEIDFGNYALGEKKPANESGAITLTGGSPTKKIELSISEELILQNTGGMGQVVLTMSLDNGTTVGQESVSEVILDGSGDGTSNLTASINAVPTAAGDYTGTAIVTVEYN